MHRGESLGAGLTGSRRGKVMGVQDRGPSEESEFIRHRDVLGPAARQAGLSRSAYEQPTDSLLVDRLWSPTVSDSPMFDVRARFDAGATRVEPSGRLD